MNIGRFDIPPILLDPAFWYIVVVPVAVLTVAGLIVYNWRKI